MANVDYAYEKITGALDGMAYSPKRIQDRLYDACQSMGIVDANDFPPELQHEWNVFLADVTAVSDTKLGSFRASTMGMTEQDAVESAQKLVNFRHTLKYHIMDRDVGRR